MKRYPASLFLVTLSSAASIVGAADKVAPAIAVTAIAPAATGAGSLFQVLLSLFLVLGLMMGAAWAIKRFGPKRMAGSATVRVVGGVSLGGRERIVVVEAADQWIVVGVAPGRVNALATMPKQETPTVSDIPVSGKNFADWLKQTIEKRNGH